MNRTPEDVALTLVSGLLREGGATATARVNDTVPSTGYVVSIPTATLTVPADDVQPYVVTGWVSRHLSVLSEGGKHAGAWLDRETGLVYLDVNEVFDNLDEATLAALAAGQVAVYDLSERRELRTADLAEVS